MSASTPAVSANQSEAVDFKSFLKMTFSLVLPMAIQNLINTAITSADVMMLGKVGETALSASSLAGQVQFIMNLIFFGLTSGAAVLTAQYWGSQNITAFKRAVTIMLRLTMLFAVAFSVITYVACVDHALLSSAWFYVW